MKILLLGFAKLAYMPYINFYLEELACDENEIHILYWNRDDKSDIKLPYNVIFHEFKLYQEDEVKKYKKIPSFIKYRKYANELIKKDEFDLIIVLSTLPGVLLYNVLKKQYANRYIFDYRDFTFENIKFYKNIVRNLIINSKVTFVSSNGFRKYLPKLDKIYTTHNILLDSIENRIKRNELQQKHNPIRVGCWGFIKYESVNKKIIEQLANDSRFEIHYYGRQQSVAYNLKEYCSKNNVKNVYFHGEYKPEERYEFQKETDILNNLYDINLITSSAMSNKYYDGIVFYIPQICSLGSFMGAQVEKVNVGLNCDPYRENFADILYDYYKSIKWEEFEKNCDLELERVLNEYNSAKRILKESIKYCDNSINLENQII
ncbi:glycosyltransferase [Clostridium cibarium]|uniref:Glycosyltransferase subfamily 4-like N-terminal domain-containing protein n=1 Tax=Clostridium cibarium TaxID=2762247 RepID=A0ABR8PYS2_9CLOT|nr:glycosyltransferase [Clostridium cibarium]MBD7913308.1 hypothetical protein [Clostridium cibarium]